MFFAHIGLSLARTVHFSVPTTSGKLVAFKTRMVVENWLRRRTFRLIPQGGSRGTLQEGSDLNTKELLEGLKLSGKS